MEVDKIILPEEEAGVKLAKGIMDKSIIEMIDLSEGYSIVELNVSEKWVNKTIEEIDLRNVYGLNVLCIKNKSKDIVISPLPNHILQSGDVLVGIAYNEKFNKKHSAEEN